ncbi:hypothetical protein ACXR0O_23975 [Verrucomicrobiota bacterium sgz303538]
MKTTLSISVLWLSIALSHSAPPEPAYPPTELAFDKLSFKRVTQKDLPTGVNFYISQGAESNEDPDYAGKVCYLDLNNDGTKEIIVESPTKHTDQYEIWQKRKGRWVSLLTVWGRPDFLRRRNGYYQITVWNEDRQGDGTCELYAFEGERFHLIRLDRYRGDTFLGAGDVQEREQVLEHNFKEQFRE